MIKLNEILLIDDNEADNFLHEMVIKDTNCCEKVVIMESAIDALAYLKSVDTLGKHPQPDLIFLDINMPAMNGWEFLDEYEKLADNQKGKIVVIMLTTSLNPKDLEKSKEIGYVGDFKNKPLTQETLSVILENYFPE